MKTRITTLFGTEFPIIQAGMIWCSSWRLASAVSNAGGLGLIGAGSMTPEILEEHIRKCKAATGKPFGVNIPLLYAKVEQQFDVIFREGVKIVFTSAGNPATWTPLLKQQGITVVHVVANAKSALKCEQSGVDAVVAEGFEAGGHNGREETTTMTLIPLVREATRLPLIAAGGIATGRGMLAAMALGADGVQVGSRFVACEESSAHPAFKQKILETGDGDTMLSLKKLMPVRLIRNDFQKKIMEMEARGASPEELAEFLGKGRARMGMFEGDLEEGELEIGQAAAMIRQTGRFAVDDGARRFGSDIARGETGPTGDEDNVQVAAVGPGHERFAQDDHIIGQDGLAEDRPTPGLDEFHQRRARKVGAFAARGTVGSSQNSKTKGHL